MATGNESQAGIPPHGIEGVLNCHENPPRGFPSLGLLPLAAKLGLKNVSSPSPSSTGPGISRQAGGPTAVPRAGSDRLLALASKPLFFLPQYIPRSLFSHSSSSFSPPLFCVNVQRSYPGPAKEATPAYRSMHNNALVFFSLPI